MAKKLTTTADAAIDAVSGAALLKLDFAQGNVPSSEHFAALIDLANLGPKTLGLTDDTGPLTPPAPGEGLELDTGKLRLKIATNAAITRNANGLTINRGAGLVTTGDVLAVGQGNGISTDAAKVTVVAKADGALLVEAAGVSVVRGNGLVKTGNNLAVAGGQGITVNANAVAANLGTGLGFDSSGKIECLVTNQNVFVTGMIMMFSGSTAPAGWIFCDGRDNRAPNLIGRFVVGKGPGGHVPSTAPAMSGDEKAYSFNAAVAEKTVTGNVSTGNTTLNMAHMPSHRHGHGVRTRDMVRFAAFNGGIWTELSGTRNNYLTVTSGYEITSTGRTSPTTIGDFSTALTGSTSPSGHNHTASHSLKTAGETIRISPPYYALAFIMKL